MSGSRSPDGHARDPCWWRTVTDRRTDVTSVGWIPMTTRRPLVVALVTLCGLAITAGAALPWIKARGSRPASGITHTSLVGLRHLTYTHSATSTSFAVAVAAAGILLVVSGLVASRVLAGVLSVIAQIGRASCRERV